MLAKRLVLGLAAVWWGLGCGASSPQSRVPDQDVSPDSEVVVESGTLMLVDESDMVPVSIRFPVDGVDLDEKDKRVLDLLAEFLAANEQLARIRVQGHSDERGTDQYNLRLSRRRAVVVADYLGSQGIEESRLRVEWYGDKRPVVRGESEVVWSQNRRVEFVVATRPGT